MSSVSPPGRTEAMSAMAAKKTVLTRVRSLDLPPGTEPRFIAAASGLVQVGKRFWVVPDDEHVMASFPVSGGPGKVLTVFPGRLPEDPKQRKAAKPDLEALFVMPRAVAGGTSDLLVAVGSGSKSNRYRGVVVPVGAGGEPSGPTRIIDWTPLYSRLAAEFPRLNIEGAAIVGDRLCLGQRGNGKNNVSALVELDLGEVARAIRQGLSIPPSALRGIKRLELGEKRGVAWTITDLAPLPDGRLVFSAAAESSTDVVEDGAVIGSAIGILEADGTVATFVKTDPVVKVEGVCIVGHAAGSVHLALVTDGDDATKPAVMYRVDLPL